MKSESPSLQGTRGIFIKHKNESEAELLKSTFKALIGNVHRRFYLVEYTQIVLK